MGNDSYVFVGNLWLGSDQAWQDEKFEVGKHARARSCVSCFFDQFFAVFLGDPES